MAEKKVLDFKPTWWLEQIGYQRCKVNTARRSYAGRGQFPIFFTASIF
jgi:hypothetical protein